MLIEIKEEKVHRFRLPLGLLTSRIVFHLLEKEQGASAQDKAKMELSRKTLKKIVKALKKYRRKNGAFVFVEIRDRDGTELTIRI
jgi:hypothetical protein